MSPYRKTKRLVPVERPDDAVKQLLAEEKATLAATPSFEEICANYETHIGTPETIEETVSCRLSQTRSRLLEILAPFAPSNLISVQEFIRVSLGEALRGHVEPEKEADKLHSLFNKIAFHCPDFPARKLTSLNLSTEEGRDEALGLLQSMIEKINDPEQLLKKVLKERYVETNDITKKYDASGIGRVVPVGKEDLPGYRLSQKQRENLEYIMLALGSRMQLAAGAIDESSKEIEGNQVEKVQEFLYLFGDEKRSEMGNQLEGFSIDRSGIPKEKLRVASVGFFILGLLYPLTLAPGYYEKAKTAHVISLIVLALVSLYLFLFRRKNRLLALRDSHPLESIQKEMQQELAIFKILTQLEENYRLIFHTNLDKFELASVVAKRKVLDAMLQAVLNEDDPTKREATIQVGDSIIHLGPAAFQQTLDGWSINIGTEQKPEWVFGSLDPHYQATQKLLPQVPIEDLSAQKQALEAAQLSEHAGENEARDLNQGPRCARA